MHILGVDTSTRVASVAFLEDGEVRLARNAGINVTHSESLLRIIHEVCDELRLPASAIDLLAVVSGPGSFTGLRVGIGTVMGLSWSLETPAVSVSSLDVLAACAREDEHGRDADVLACALEAHRGDVYFRSFQPDGTPDDENERIVPGLEVPALVDGRACFIGDGLDTWRETWSVALGDQYREARTESLERRGEMTARLGGELYASGLRTTAADLRPRYIRPAAPEERRGREQGGGDV